MRKRLSFRSVLLFATVGSRNSIVSVTLLQLSIKYGNASTAATLVSTNLLFVSLFVFIAGEKLVKRKFFGTLFGLMGIIVFAYGKIVGDTFTGIFFGVSAALSFALCSLIMKRVIVKYEALVSTAYSSFFFLFQHFIWNVADYHRGTLFSRAFFYRLVRGPIS